jgi:predicted O-methyltransferase YrrM
MLTCPEQMQFLQLLIKLTGTKKIIEVGCFTGYGTLCMSLALPEDGKIVTLDVNSTYPSIGAKFWREAGVENKIDLRIAPALDSLSQLLDNGEAGTYDFVYIDADKLNQKEYVNKSYELLKQNGLIGIDNTLMGGYVYDESVQNPNIIAIRDLNTSLLTDDRFDLAMTTIGDGLTFLRKK